MQVKTILNRLHKFKSFVYKSVIWTGPKTAPQLEVEVVERANSKPVCFECRFPRPGYDRLPQRRFEFVPLWGIKVFLVYGYRFGCNKFELFENIFSLSQQNVAQSVMN